MNKGVAVAASIIGLGALGLAVRKRLSGGSEDFAEATATMEREVDDTAAHTLDPEVLRVKPYGDTRGIRNAKQYRFTAVAPDIEPKIRAMEILEGLWARDPAGVERALYVEAVFCLLSGIPKKYIPPEALRDQEDEVASYQNDVPVWILTFVDVNPQVYGPGPDAPTSFNSVFHAETGHFLFGFPGY